MATVVATFTTLGGILVHEERGGSESNYTPDPLGSLIECRNSSGTKTYSAEYWPYGEIQASSGSNPSSWSFVGLLGYLADSVSMLYVRARYLVNKWARWLTADPIWPDQAAYGYVSQSPTQFVDILGLFMVCYGISGTAIIEVIGGWAGAQMCVDFAGNVGYQTNYGYGVGNGLGIGIGTGPSFSTGGMENKNGQGLGVRAVEAECVGLMQEIDVDVEENGGFGGLGIGGLHGADRTIVGEGIGAIIGINNTQSHRLFNVLDLLKRLIPIGLNRTIRIWRDLRDYWRMIRESMKNWRRFIIMPTTRSLLTAL